MTPYEQFEAVYRECVSEPFKRADADLKDKINSVEQGLKEACEAGLRKIAIDGYVIQVDHTDIKAMTAEIQKIGVNVNQIAKRVNSAGSVYQEDIEEIKRCLRKYGGYKD